jgi:hypothetical protein
VVKHLDANNCSNVLDRREARLFEKAGLLAVIMPSNR